MGEEDVEFIPGYPVVKSGGQKKGGTSILGGVKYLVCILQKLRQSPTDQRFC